MLLSAINNYNAISIKPAHQKTMCRNNNNLQHLGKDTVSFSNGICFKGGGENWQEIKGKETSAKVFTNNLDYKAYGQIKACCDHPVFKDIPIRIMPDVQAGRNNVVGFSACVPDKNAFIPNIIGGDIGCGMLCVKLDTKGESIDFEKLDTIIRTYVSGKNPKRPVAEGNVPEAFNKKLERLCKDTLEGSPDSYLNGLGVLGGGNHFIEIDKDKKGDTYLVIHSGSKRLGIDIANHYQKVAEETNPYKIKELSYVSGDEAKQYFNDTKIGKEYAQLNRRMIADIIMNKMGWREASVFESIHNYISDDGTIRKGAICADEGMQMIIPLNMKDGAILATGKGSAEWNNSAPHGAGRKFSRSDAAEALSYEDYENDMQGIFTTCVKPQTLDEAPKAYKDVSEITSAIGETAGVQEVIRPIYNFKG